MKTAPQIESENRHLRGESSGTTSRAFPLTDYAFQPSAKTLRTSAVVGEKEMAELHTFRKISRDFLGAEMTRDYVTEALFFVSMTCVAAWPMGVAIHQLTRWMI